MRVILIFWIYIFFCQIIYAKDCSFDPQSKMFYKADGTKIKFSFGRHANVEFRSKTLEQLQKIVQDSKENKKTVHESMNKILAENQKVIESINNQIGDLKKYSVQWVGLEFSPKELEVEDVEAGSTLKILTKFNYPKNKIENYKKLTLGPAKYFFATSEKKQPKIIGLEDYRVKTFAKILYRVGMKLIGIFDDLEEKGVITEKDSKVILEAYRGSVANSEIVSNRQEVKELIARYGGDLKTIIEEYINNRDAFAEIATLREYMVAQNAYTQSGDGIIFMGEFHEDSVKDFLFKTCKGESKRPSRPSLSKFAEYLYINEKLPENIKIPNNPQSSSPHTENNKVDKSMQKKDDFN